MPVVLYNVPGRTGINMDVKTTARLSEIQNIVAVKAPGDLVQMSEIISATLDFIVLSGDDPVTVATMAVGGAGVVSVASKRRRRWCRSSSCASAATMRPRGSCTTGCCRCSR